MIDNNENTNEIKASVDVRTPIETAGSYLSREAKLVARVADPETREVLEKLAAALKNPDRVRSFITA